MKDLKYSYTVTLSSYAVANNFQNDPDLSWWLPFILNKRLSVIEKINSKYWQRTQKYGIRVPNSIQESKEIVETNGNTLWVDQIRREIRDNWVVFDTCEGGIDNIIGYEELTEHLIFYVKLKENLRRKTRLMENGHLF